MKERNDGLSAVKSDVHQPPIKIDGGQRKRKHNLTVDQPIPVYAEQFDYIDGPKIDFGLILHKPYPAKHAGYKRLVKVLDDNENVYPRSEDEINKGKSLFTSCQKL